ncbi:hypothetical protein MTO96_002748 [Rhipicephalus appendiculatus]
MPQARSPLPRVSSHFARTSSSQQRRRPHAPALSSVDAQATGSGGGLRVSRPEAAVGCAHRRRRGTPTAFRPWAGLDVTVTSDITGARRAPFETSIASESCRRCTVFDNEGHTQLPRRP